MKSTHMQRINQIDKRTRALADKLTAAARKGAEQAIVTTVTDGRFTATLGRIPRNSITREPFLFHVMPEVEKFIKSASSVTRTASGKCPSSPSATQGRAEAIALYKTERNAIDTIRRQVETMGKDIDLAVAKRALALADELECGHTFILCLPTKWNRKTRQSEPIPGLYWHTNSTTIDINAALGRVGDAWQHYVSNDELNTLRELGYIIHTPSPN